ncbi:hypothetical protein J6590_012918 [Homalodisca vitripennis]|nr:hypothetical protein J6590_012918 [Homalodisca vitripennis]
MTSSGSARSADGERGLIASYSFEPPWPDGVERGRMCRVASMPKAAPNYDDPVTRKVNQASGRRGAADCRCKNTALTPSAKPRSPTMNTVIAGEPGVNKDCRCN